ncbi:MAG: hypothetical protein ABIF08_04670, partial [Nanoarchaeota archaeon]
MDGRFVGIAKFSVALFVFVSLFLVFWYFPVGQASPDAVIVILTAPESNQNITNTSAFIFKATTNMSAPDM